MMPSVTTIAPAGAGTRTATRTPTPEAISAPASREFAVTLRPLPGESIAEVFHRLARTLHGATILKLMIFGATAASAAATAAMQRTFGHVDWPVSWIEGNSCQSLPIAGIHAFALTSDDVDRIWIDGHVVGTVFHDDIARHCLLGGVVPSRRFPARADQAKHTLVQLDADLAQAGFALADIVRTWFYLEDILSWYDEFNRVRTEIYHGIQFRTGSLPASTGIGARNPHGTALILGARASQPLPDSPHAEEIGSPLQCPAPAYGSSFSRAMEIPTSSGRILTISGTASIAPGGETLWQDDIHKQIELTMQTVAAILQSRGRSFGDVTRAVAYFKNPADMPAFAQWCAAHGLAELPVIPVQGTICRDNLLFELEADAIQPG